MFSPCPYGFPLDSPFSSHLPKINASMWTSNIKLLTNTQDTHKSSWGRVARVNVFIYIYFFKCQNRDSVGQDVILKEIIGIK